MFAFSYEENNWKSLCRLKLGFSVIHGQRDLPRKDHDDYKYLFYYKESEAVDVLITPKIVTTDESLRYLSPEKY